MDLVKYDSSKIYKIAEKKFINDFIAAWIKVMKLDRLF